MAILDSERHDLITDDLKAHEGARKSSVLLGVLLSLGLRFLYFGFGLGAGTGRRTVLVGRGITWFTDRDGSTGAMSRSSAV